VEAPLRKQLTFLLLFALALGLSAQGYRLPIKHELKAWSPTVDSLVRAALASRDPADAIYQHYPILRVSDDRRYIDMARIKLGSIETVLRILGELGIDPAEVNALCIPVCGLTDLAGYEKFRGVIFFDFSSNDLTAMPDFSILPRLRNLRLDGNRISSIAPVARVRRYGNLDLADNESIDLGAILSRYPCEYLVLSNCRLEGLREATGKALPPDLDLDGTTGFEVADLLRLLDGSAVEALSLHSIEGLDYATFFSLSLPALKSVVLSPGLDGKSDGSSEVYAYFRAAQGLGARMPKLALDGLRIFDKDEK
jgi:hypothetical protein